MGDPGDGDSAIARKGEVPSGEVQVLVVKVQPVNKLVGEDETLPVLTLLP